LWADYFNKINNMRYSEFQNAISAPRIQRYLTASANDNRKTMRLYRANIRLSQEMFAVLSIFEVVFRNAIDKQYTGASGNNWLVTASNPGGYLTAHGCNKSLASVQAVINKLGTAYTHDKAIAELGFGFWRYQFAAKEFAAGGSVLHTIFPGRPFGTNHTDIFKRLTAINKIRNRIAHHEPICFDPLHAISTAYVNQKYNIILELFQWLSYNPTAILYGVDHVQREVNYINSI
jgi:hypothetical protein